MSRAAVLSVLLAKEGGQLSRMYEERRKQREEEV